MFQTLTPFNSDEALRKAGASKGTGLSFMRFFFRPPHPTTAPLFCCHNHHEKRKNNKQVGRGIMRSVIDPSMSVLASAIFEEKGRLLGYEIGVPRTFKLHLGVASQKR